MRHLAQRPSTVTVGRVELSVAQPGDRNAQLRRQGLDQDGDGEANEDWSDGADNDGDGLIDEDDWDAELVGLEGDNGRPAGNGEIPFFNRALQVTALEDTTEDLRIRDLAFRTFIVAVGFFPDLAFETRRCEGISTTGGSLVGARIENSRLRNTSDGIELKGDVEEARLKGNLATEDNIRSVFMTGGSERCATEDGTIETIPFGTPTDNRVQENTFANVVMVDVDGTEVRDNALIQLERVTLFLRGGSGVEIKNNVIVSVLGMTVFDAADGVVKGNLFQDATAAGMILTGTTNGFEIKGNLFERTSTIADIFLAGGTSSNRVVVGPLDTVFDFGTDNEVVIDDDD